MTEYQENREICHCKHVTFLDVEKAMHDSKTFPEVEKTFEEVQKRAGFLPPRDVLLNVAGTKAK